MSEAAEVAAFGDALRAAFTRFKAEEAVIRAEHATAVRSGTLLGPLDDEIVLERPTRRFLIDPMLRALDWESGRSAPVNRRGEELGRERRTRVFRLSRRQSAAHADPPRGGKRRRFCERSTTCASPIRDACESSRLRKAGRRRRARLTEALACRFHGPTARKARTLHRSPEKGTDHQRKTAPKVVSYAARRQAYRQCRPPTRGRETTVADRAGRISTGRPCGVSLPMPRCVRSSW